MIVRGDRLAKVSSRTIRVQSEEPVFLLLVGHDMALLLLVLGPFLLETRPNAHLCLGPFGAIEVLELFKHDLNFLSIGRVHRDEMKSLANLHERLLDRVSIRSNGFLLWHSSPPQVSNLRRGCGTSWAKANVS